MNRALLAFAVALTGCPEGPPRCDGATCKPIATGTTPNDLALTTCDGEPVALVPASGDNRLDAIAVPGGDVVASTDTGPSSTPWAVALHGDRAIATMFGRDAVFVVESCRSRIVSNTAIAGASKPEPVIVVGDVAYVGFTNIIRFSTGPGDPPELDAGVVARFTIAGDDLVNDGVSVALPCKNPQGLVQDGADLWASCSGPLGPNGGGVQTALEDGALVLLDGATLDVKRVVGAGRHAPGTPAIIGGTVYVGSVIEPAVFKAGPADTELVPALALDGPAVEAVFELKTCGDTLIVPQFTADKLLFVKDDVVTSELQIGPGGSAFHGLLAIDVQPGFGDVDAAALFTLSAELVPLRLHEAGCP